MLNNNSVVNNENGQRPYRLKHNFIGNNGYKEPGILRRRGEKYRRYTYAEAAGAKSKKTPNTVERKFLSPRGFFTLPFLRLRVYWIDIRESYFI